MDRVSMRLASGGQIDRAGRIGFTFDGRAFAGHPGDTLASALLAAGVHLVGRSFKYHRPRGILTAGSEEPNALVELRDRARREPNTRATTVELYDGLVARSQNRWPSLAFDVMAVNQLAGPLLSAGFYYKTFKWPASFWERVYEPLIRRAAGLGRAAGAADPDTYEKATRHCDVLVVGAGPAGLMAALAAGRAGARVILVEEDFAPGGRCLAETLAIDGMPAADWAARTVAELEAMPKVAIFRRTCLLGLYDGGTHAALERVGDHLYVPELHRPRQRLWRFIARRTVLAAGAIERPLVFGDNDRPGIMLAGAVRSYLNRFAVRPGSRAVVFSNNDDAARTVGDLARAGVVVSALVDARPQLSPALADAARAAGARVFTGAAIVGVEGRGRVEGVEVASAAGRIAFPCDLVAMSGGWSPTVHLSSHLGGRPAWEEAISSFGPGLLPPGLTVAGAAAGRFSLADCLASGAEAGRAAASEAGFADSVVDIPAADPEETGVMPFWRVPVSRGKAFVDFQNDVTAADIELAEREGFRAVEHLKRYTTLGMATDQGKTANLNGLAIMAALRGRSIPATGVTTFRPPFSPVAIGALAGHHRGKAFRPTRLTPAHGWAQEAGAVFIEAGAWLRAQWFPQPGESGWLESVTREVKAIRSGVGLCDVSTLGKIDLQGRDAAEFLNRLYINGWSTLAVGRARYGVMLREDGFVFDDGTTSRLADDHFVMTTTTANAGRVLQHMDFCHQVLWPDLDVAFVSISDQWAQFAVAGPASRAVLERVVDAGHDISNAAFPYMGAAEITAMGGIVARLFRISFSGELAYEIAVPARFGDALARALMAAGEGEGITPYGLEALSAMRIEKGHVAGGELNGTTTARDLGLGRMASTKKDFIGRVMAGRPALIDPDRPSLVGVRPVDPDERISAGAHFLAEGAQARMENDLGYLTSATWSPTLSSWIGLGLLANGPARIGGRVRAWDSVRGRDTVVEVCAPCFHDPDGERLRG